MMMLDTVTPMIVKEYNSNVNNVDLDADFRNTGMYGSVGSGEIIMAKIASGVTIGSTSTSGKCIALSNMGADLAIIQNRGTVSGKGGAGGAGGQNITGPPSNGSPGGSGGTAISASSKLIIDNASGTIGGGSGGNGGVGAASFDACKGCDLSAGAAGSGGTNGGGANGSTGANGAWNCGQGGSGGAGGTRGKYTDSNSNITWLANGTRLGSVS